MRTKYKILQIRIQVHGTSIFTGLKPQAKSILLVFKIYHKIDQAIYQFTDKTESNLLHFCCCFFFSVANLAKLQPIGGAIGRAILAELFKIKLE